jgi:hypothetical protein
MKRPYGSCNATRQRSPHRAPGAPGASRLGTRKSMPARIILTQSMSGQRSLRRWEQFGGRSSGIPLKHSPGPDFSMASLSFERSIREQITLAARGVSPGT